MVKTNNKLHFNWLCWGFLFVVLHLGSSSPYFGKMNTSTGLCAGNYAPAPFPISWMVASPCPCTPGSMLQCRLASSPPSRGPSARIHKIREKAAKLPVFHSPAPFLTAATPRLPGRRPRRDSNPRLWRSAGRGGAPPPRQGAATALIARSAEGGKRCPGSGRRARWRGQTVDRALSSGSPCSRGSSAGRLWQLCAPQARAS